MKPFGLASVTLLSLAFTASLLPASGWLSNRSCARSGARFREPCFQVRAGDLPSGSAQRCQNGQPTHWRYLVLHR